MRRCSTSLLLLFLPYLLYSQWLNEEQLTNLEGGSFLSYNNAHCITTTKTNKIYLVWFDANPTSYYRSNIYYRKYDLGWQQVTKLTSSSFHSAFPSLVIDDLEYKYLAWFEFPPSPLANDSIAFDLWFCAPSLNPSLITPLTSTNSYSLYPSLTMDREDVLHLVWQDNRDGGGFNIFYKYFKDYEWSSDTNLTPEGVGQYPCICAEGDAIYLVWQDSRSGATEIYFKNLKGGVWTSNTALTEDSCSSVHPFIATDGNENVHLVWHDSREGTDRIFYKFYDGTVWSFDSCITPTGCDARYPQGVVDTDGNFHLVWEDSRSGHCEIYYKKWSGIWSEDTALTRYPALARQPHIASDALDNLHVVWEDYRGDSTFAPEIYYKKYASGKEGREFRVQNLIQCYPNPFSIKTEIRFQISDARRQKPGIRHLTSDISLRIYDISGRLIRLFRGHPCQHRWYSVFWDGRDEKGKPVPSGVYFAMIRFDSKSFAKKICLIR